MTIFWHSEGVIFKDALPKDTTMNAEYYSKLIERLREEVKSKRRGKVSRGIFFLQDNAPLHTARVAKAAVAVTGFHELDHPPYIPDLAPSDYFLFRNL